MKINCIAIAYDGQVSNDEGECEVADVRVGDDLLVTFKLRDTFDSREREDIPTLPEQNCCARNKPIPGNLPNGHVQIDGTA